MIPLEYLCCEQPFCSLAVHERVTLVMVGECLAKTIGNIAACSHVLRLTPSACPSFQEFQNISQLQEHAVYDTVCALNCRRMWRVWHWVPSRLL
jgi:hypothetical protein